MSLQHGHPIIGQSTATIKPAMSLVIQPVSASDVGAIAALARIVWQSVYAEIITQAQIDYMLEQRYNAARMLAELKMPGYCWDQALIDGERAGFAAGYPAGVAGEFKLDKLYVHPACQRRGIGSALIERVCEHARAAGCGTLFLAVNKRNAAAISAYRKAHFAVRESLQTDIGAGFIMDDFIMVRSIQLPV